MQNLLEITSFTIDSQLLTSLSFRKRADQPERSIPSRARVSRVNESRGRRRRIQSRLVPETPLGFGEQRRHKAETRFPAVSPRSARVQPVSQTIRFAGRQTDRSLKITRHQSRLETQRTPRTTKGSTKHLSESGSLLPMGSTTSHFDPANLDGCWNRIRHIAVLSQRSQRTPRTSQRPSHG